MEDDWRRKTGKTDEDERGSWEEGGETRQDGREGDD
jgi:hypothetical protein